jgi:radical SAM protein with 4Fe4S-binding SPASM domain
MLDPAILRSSLESILSAQGGAEPVFYEPFHWVLHGGGTPRFRCKQRVFCGADGRYKPCPFYPRSFATAREVAAERAGEPLPRKCEGCEHAETCHGGCPATRLVVRGSLSERDPLCPLAEGRP